MPGMTDLFDKGLDKAMPDEPGEKSEGECTISDLRAVASPEDAEVLDRLEAKVKGEPTEEEAPPADSGPPMGD